jgi:signal recognition particle subunit SRP54
MGDVLSLIERVEQAVDQDEAQRLSDQVRLGDFTLENFRDQLRTVRRMGPFEQVIGLLPGMGGLKQLGQPTPDDKQLSRIEAIIDSMTPEERHNHRIINGGRRKRIARGSGTRVEDVNRLLKQFVQMRKVVKMLGGMAGIKKDRRRVMRMLQRQGI